MNNELVNQILSYFKFTEVEIIMLSLLFVFFIVQIFFYFRYYRKPFNYAVKENIAFDQIETQMVSVVLVSRNEVENLREVLPLILAQKYPKFEVIVVNDGSTDESHELLESLKLKYPNLYHTFLPFSSDTQFGRRKLAMTIGIKAAKGDVLLFTEPYCRPLSDKWIKCLAEKISPETDVVLGYAYYKKENKFYNRVARFDNHLFSMQYLSRAIQEKPFTGTYRNVAFKKHLFFDNKGFSSHLNIENGEDLFINQIVNYNNTEVSLSQNSFVETQLNNYSMWRHLKKDYSIAKSKFKTKATTIFAIESITRFSFYTAFVIILAFAGIFQSWGVMACASLLFISRLIIQLTIINKSARYFHSGVFRFSLILVDLIQPIYNFRFKTHAKGIRGKRLR